MITAQGLKQLGFAPLVDFVLQDDGDGTYIAEWKSDQVQPSVDEIESAHAEWQTEYDSKAYARARATAYPSVSDFMEAYTEKEIGGSSTKWDAYVTAYNKVRTDNPKP
jgi:hypothetical protein